MNKISEEIRRKVLERDNFTCQKCGFKDATSEELEIHHIKPKIFQGKDNFKNLVALCSICHKHAPDDEFEFKGYISEKIDYKILETFRKSRYSISKRTKEGMQKKAQIGKHMARPPLGYKFVEGRLEPEPEKKEIVQQIFNKFLDTTNSLSQLAKEYSFTTRGLINLLRNRTYLGEIKFKGNFKGNHDAILPKEIFDKAGEKLNQISLQRKLIKNYHLVNKILVQGDLRYLDPYSMNILSHFIAQGAVLVVEREISQITQPTDSNIEKIDKPQRLAKYIAFNLLKKEGFSNSEILFEKNVKGGKTDLAALSDEKQVFVECHSCRVNKVIDYLSQNAELWVITAGALPWEKQPLGLCKQWFVFIQGPNWKEVFKEYQTKNIEFIKNCQNIMNFSSQINDNTLTIFSNTEDFSPQYLSKEILKIIEKF